MSGSHQHNRQAWDNMVRRGDRFTRPARDQDFQDPLRVVDGLGWLGASIEGRDVLCLGAGGGRQSALYAAAGAQVTVVDISGAMLELDRAVAMERKLQIRTVCTSMEDLSMLPDGSFDMVIQPVSTCYVSDLTPVYREVARVTRDRGLYVSQHKQPISLQCGLQPGIHAYDVREPYYRSGPLPGVDPSRLREHGTHEFLHRWEQLIGIMCRAGFSIEDLVEPFHAQADAAPGSFGHRCQFIPPYVRVKARRRQRSSGSCSAG